jgi:Rrf2 family nitric oxide-sensitive transcriptional repressor
MKLTKSTDFAMRMLIELAKSEKVHTLEYLSHHLGVSYNNLTKIAQMLSKSGIIITQKGKHGGVKLLKDPAIVSLRQVVDVIDGPTLLSECQKDSELCSLSTHCKLKLQLSKLQTTINNSMEDITLDVLV